MSQPNATIEKETAGESDSAQDSILDGLMEGVDDGATPAADAVSDSPAAVEPGKIAGGVATAKRRPFITVLKRDGVPQEIIDGATDAQLEAWAAKAAKRQKDVDDYAKRLKEAEKKAGITPANADEDELEIEGEDDAADAGVATPAADPAADGANNPLAKVVELLGPEAAKPIMEMAERLAKLEKAQQAPPETSLPQKIEAADAILRKDYGEKAPDRSAVLAEAVRLATAKPGTYPSVLAIMEQAFKNLSGSRPAARPPAKSNNSQPTVNRTVVRKERPKTPAEADDARLDEILDG